MQKVEVATRRQCGYVYSKPKVRVDATARCRGRAVGGYLVKD